jgi:hypothetical protein
MLLLPKGEGVTQFEIYYGDGTVAGFVNWEGKYLINTKKVNFKQKLYTINGKKTETMQEVMVSFGT